MSAKHIKGFYATVRESVANETWAQLFPHLRPKDATPEEMAAFWKAVDTECARIMREQG